MFLTPYGSLVALAAALPLAALAAASRRDARGRRRLGLPAPARERMGLVLAAIPLLLGLAAAQPAIRSTAVRHMRTDAQVLFVFDVSGSMDAAAGPNAPTRLQEAQRAAVELRQAIPDAASGIATLTTQLLPELLPTPDVATFDSTVERVIGIEEPPPPLLSYGTLGTSFEPLSYIRSEGYFAPTAKHRLLVLLTDGESDPFDPQATATALTQSSTTSAFSGLTTETDWPASLLIVRVGHPTDHIYEPDGSVDAAYRPEPHAAAIASTFATLAGGGAYPTSNLAGAKAVTRKLLGKGRSVAAGRVTRTAPLARLVAAVALCLVGFVLWRRNVTLQRPAWAPLRR
ncbi:MAG TPA: vWA domain-containing protein [Gaiellaceae bacterium]|nr:vWA domain-containing protein [Gaiellaceae bacterium]